MTSSVSALMIETVETLSEPRTANSSKEKVSRPELRSSDESRILGPETSSITGSAAWTTMLVPTVEFSGNPA